jgi:LPS sulfotransferase NodH
MALGATTALAWHHHGTAHSLSAGDGLVSTTLAPPEYVIVVARQRSGSTFLAISIAKQLKQKGGLVVWNADEPWAESTVRADNAHVDQLVNWTHAQRMQDPGRFLQELHAAYCSEQKAMPGACVIVLKLFDIHLEDTSADQLASIFAYPGARVVVLERDAAEERCSLLWAQQTNQWWTPNGTEREKRDGYDQFKRDRCDTLSQEAQGVYLKHRSWFGMVNSALTNVPNGHLRSLNVTYESNVNSHDQVMALISQRLLTTRM